MNKDGSLGNVQALKLDNLAGVRDFVQENSKATYHFKNEFGDAVDIKWYDIAHEDSDVEDPFKKVATLASGAATTISSFIGHTFAAFLQNEIIAKFTVRFDGDEGVVKNDGSETCSPEDRQDPNAKTWDAYFDKKNLRQAIREDVFDLALEKRLALNDVQVRLVPNVTADGFKLIRMPEELYDRVKSWYTQNHDRLKVPESDGGPLYNQRFVPTWHTPLPPHLKSDIFDGLKPIMEEWAPKTAPLHGTSAYGIRTYDRHSYLHLHTDTANTHVVSGIINVDQQADSPWPVQIFDHSGLLHSVIMQPGDMLLYESAKLLHGRYHPFNGSFYANIFVHYAPDSWSVPL